jgi:hypothetical protein
VLRRLARRGAVAAVTLALALAFVPASAGIGPLAAQTPAVTLRVTLAPDSTPTGARAPIVRATHVLDDERWLSALRSGLPIRLHYRVERWRARNGWFDAFDRQEEWDAVVRHEPLLDQYTLLTLFGRRRQERRYATLDALGAALGFAYRIKILPTAPNRYYYSATLTITTLSDSDLNELERFLKGDLGDVAGGRETFGDALGRGATRFLLRLAGLPSVRMEAQSEAFTVRAGSPSP